MKKEMVYSIACGVYFMRGDFWYMVWKGIGPQGRAAADGPDERRQCL